MDNRDQLITFQTFYDPMLAEIIRTRLADAGIDSFLEDQYAGSNTFYNQAVGGIKLKIFERDLAQCKQILAEDNALPEDFAAGDE